MIIDFFMGATWFLIGLALGFNPSFCGYLFAAALFLDADILINEFIRIFIKKEKKFNLHLPIIILPSAFLIGFFWQGIVFGILLAATVLSHLVHDTVDKNIDGICWLWPFTKNSYKFKKIGWEIKSRKRLAEEAEWKKRNSGRILKDNL